MSTTTMAADAALQPPSRIRAKTTTLADRMKHYEAAYDFTLPSNQPVILRLDGHGFSRFTSHFCRPFDQRIHEAMVAACSDLLDYFSSATVAYTQSDEITLVFPNGINKFNERVQKLVSVAASYCSVRFNLHLSALLSANPEPKVKDTACQALGTAHFDGRFFVVPSVEEALNCLLWRCRGDAIRNSVSAFARTLFSTQQMHRKTAAELRDMILQSTGACFEDSVPKWALEGCLLKREKIEHKGFNPITGKEEMTLRTKTRVEDRGVTEYNDANLSLVTDKFW